jgi:hypothetical protein
VLRRVRALRGIDTQGDALIYLADRGHELRDVVILGVVGGAAQVPYGGLRGSNPACGPDVLHDRPVAFLRPLRGHASPLKVAVGDDVPLDGLVLVMVRVDEPRHDDHAAGVDDLGRRVEIRPDRRDFGTLDQDVGLLEVADGRIHRQHGAALEQHPAP